MKLKFVISVLTAIFCATSIFSVDAAAEPSFFTNNCAGCHSNDTATCNGCHAHGVWQDSNRSLKNLTATTDLDQYQPGQTVTVTFSGGYRQGWIRAILYNENGTEIDRVTGPTGMGDDGSGSTALQFPVLLAAPAPSTPGFYTWEVAWFGSPFDKNNSTVFPHVEERVSTNEFEVYVLPTCQDADSDGYEDSACNADPLNGGGDCDDTNPVINPGAAEVAYNGVDDDCSASTPDDDLDGDGYLLANDCDDTDAAVNPGASEVCDDGIDNDCDGLIDSNDPDCSGPPPIDADGDGYTADQDCNDNDPAVNPGASEVCDDGIDNDCDGLMDQADSDCGAPSSSDFQIVKLEVPKSVTIESPDPSKKKITVQMNGNGAKGESASGTVALYKNGVLTDSASVTLKGKKKTKQTFNVTITEADAPLIQWTATLDVPGDPKTSNNTKMNSTKVVVKYPESSDDDDDDEDERENDD